MILVSCRSLNSGLDTLTKMRSDLRRLACCAMVTVVESTLLLTGRTESTLTALVLAIIGAVAASIATVASLWQGSLIRKQLAADEQVRRAAFYRDITSLFLQLDLIFYENPFVIPYFRDNKPVPSSQEGTRVMALAEYVVDLVETCLAAENVLPELEGDWDDAIHSYYRNSPAIRKYWEERGHLYPDKVSAVLAGPSRRPKQWPTQP